MDSAKVEKLRQEIEKLRRKGGVKRRELVSIAESLGRREDTSRGKEPTFVHKELPELRPLSIPAHSELKKMTARSILNQLDEDLDALEDKCV